MPRGGQHAPSLSLIALQRSLLTACYCGVVTVYGKSSLGFPPGLWKSIGWWLCLWARECSCRLLLAWCVLHTHRPRHVWHCSKVLHTRVGCSDQVPNLLYKLGFSTSCRSPHKSALTARHWGSTALCRRPVKQRSLLLLVCQWELKAVVVVPM